eukprot:s1321_g14.t3
MAGPHQDVLADFGCCCRCVDDDVGYQVSKLPEASWAIHEAGEEDEEEISFSPLVRPRPVRGHAVEEWSSLGRLRPRDLDFSELTRSGPGIRIGKIEKRGITFDQLKKILVFVKKRCDGNGVIRGWYDSRTGEQLEYRKLTLAQLHHWLIEPVTTRLQCSYVEAVAKEEYAQLPAWFVGHTWHEPFVDFVRRTMKHGTLGAGDAFWSFAFSTRWHECREMLVGGCSSVECLRTLKSLRVSLAGCTKTSTAEDLQQGRLGGFTHYLMLAEMLAQQHAAGQRVVGRLVAMQSHPFKAAAALPMSRLPCSVSQNGFDAFGMLFKNSGRRPKGEEPPRSIRAAFLGIFLARKGRSKGFFGHAYKAVKDESDMVPSAQDLKNISLSFDSGDILGDGSVMKSIVEEGVDPPVFPVFGDDCVTHFVGTLPDGSIFNDTLKRDQPFKFRLGAEHVLEGFDEGVATMRKGERAIFQLSPEVAYGSFGARDERGWQVPPDTPVTFDILLLDVIKAAENSATAQDPVPGYGREDVGSGGAGPDGKYSWKRNGAEVLVLVPVADDIETKDVSHVFQEAYISIAVRGATLLAGRPGCDVEAEECYWEFSWESGQRCLFIHLQKTPDFVSMGQCRVVYRQVFALPGCRGHIQGKAHFRRDGPMRFSLGRLDGALSRSLLGELNFLAFMRVPFLHQLSTLDLQICGSPKLMEARPFGQGISALRALTGLRLGFSSCPSLLSAGLPGKLPLNLLLPVLGFRMQVDWAQAFSTLTKLPCLRHGAVIGQIALLEDAMQHQYVWSPEIVRQLENKAYSPRARGEQYSSLTLENGRLMKSGGFGLHDGGRQALPRLPTEEVCLCAPEARQWFPETKLAVANVDTVTASLALTNA